MRYKSATRNTITDVHNTLIPSTFACRTLNSLNSSPYLLHFFSTKQVEYNLRLENLVKLPQIQSHAIDLNSVTFRGSIL